MCGNNLVFTFSPHTFSKEKTKVKHHILHLDKTQQQQQQKLLHDMYIIKNISWGA